MKTYSSKKVRVSVGDQIATGFGDAFIEVERTTNSFEPIIGADGEGSRVAAADRSGTIKLTLKQTSVTNDYLSAKLAADELTNDQTFPVFIKDGSGSTLVQASEAWIMKPAVVKFSKDGEEREWTLVTTDLFISVGGNA